MLENNRFFVLENNRFSVLENNRFSVLENNRCPGQMRASFLDLKALCKVERMKPTAYLSIVLNPHSFFLFPWTFNSLV